MPDDIQQILQKYRQRLNEELGGEEAIGPEGLTSREYEQFKEDTLPLHFTLYEKLCNLSERILRIKPDKSKAAAIQEAIETAHLNCTPTGATSFSILGPLAILLAGVILSIVVPAVRGDGPSVFFIVFVVIAALSVMFPLMRMPDFLANSWRLRASNQMVLCVFYVVTYMRHTSNLELAIEFASKHLSGPLALDMKKILWDIETEKYSTLKESLDMYLERWRKYNMEFIEAMHLIESSLFEPSESRRLDLLDKGLDVILEETYEKMLHYAQNLKSPITTLHMLGVILPILGLVILPLMVNFMGDVKWYYLAAIYNIALPLVVYYLGKSILAARPTGYGDTDISEEIPALVRYRKLRLKLGSQEVLISPMYLSIIFGAVLLVIGLMPALLHLAGFEELGFGEENMDKSCGRDICFLSYRTDDELGIKNGPYDMISSIFSMFIPLSLALSIGLYYYLCSRHLIEIRNSAKKLEQEFSSALFQLGNRLGDGLPAEIAFEKAALILQGTTSGQFFQQVSVNIRKLGMSVPAAIFDPKIGAITQFPSKIIESSMKVLTQAVRKGPKIASQALINISRYLKEMHRVDERLKDLLADVIASMKSQIAMLTPVIAGIVVGITSMITNILGILGPMLESKASDDASIASSLPALFGIGIPTYFFQIVVGIYVVQIVYILTVLSNGIENGTDRLNEHYLLGRNMLRSGLLYAFIAVTITVIFNIIAEIVVVSSLG